MRIEIYYGISPQLASHRKPSLNLLSMHRLIIAIVFVLALVDIQSQSTKEKQELRVHFQTDQHDLDSTALQQIEEIIAQIKPDKLNRIEIKGFTDDRGSDEYNKALAERRAEAVKAYLLSRGVSQRTIQALAFGELPEPESDVDKQRQANRVVVITLEHEEVFDLKPFEPQVFEFNPRKDKSFFTSKGVMVTIPANTFLPEKGNRIFGTVEVSVTEYLTVADFVAGGMHSMSDSGLLQSGGMFNIDAKYAGGKTPRIADGKAIELTIPTDSAFDGMQVFYQGHSDQTNESFFDAKSDSANSQYSRSGLFTGRYGPAWNLATDPTFRTVKSERIEINFRDAIKALNSKEASIEDEVLAVFGELGNERELGYLLAALVSSKNEEALQRAVNIFEIESIYVGDDSAGLRPNATLDGLYPIFKQSTQREIRFSDSSFDPLLFDKLSLIFFHVKEEFRFDLLDENGRLIDLNLMVKQNQIIQRYRMRVNNLGLVNCDLFMRPGNNVGVMTTMEVAYDTADAKSINVAMAFPELNALLPAVFNGNGELYLGPAPIGREGTLVAYKTDGDVILADIRKIKIGKEPLDLEFVEMTKEELQEAMAEL